MFDQVPARVWILLAFAAVAYTPARYLYQHIAHSPSRRDITQPAEDLSWRTSGQFARSLSILAALLGLSVFIFTPTAEELARSPRFWPVLVGGLGAWALFTVSQGFATGRVEPFIKGFRDTYEREGQPKGFWASLTWNSVLGCLLIWVAYQMNEDASAQIAQDRCSDDSNAFSPQAELSACNELVRLRPKDAHSYLYRGLMFLDAGAFDEAVADFTRAHELDPENHWALANRGITYAWKRDRMRAEKDFEAVRAVDPSNPVLLRGEALLSMNAGDPTSAVERLTASLGRDPDNAWALAMRAEAYRELGEYEKSRADQVKLLELREKAN